MSKPRVRVTHDEVGQMPEGLQRKANGQYYLRRRVPKDLAEVLGWAEVSWTLGTKDPKEARRVLPQLMADLLDEFDAVRNGVLPSTLPMLSRKKSPLTSRRDPTPQERVVSQPVTTISDAEWEYFQGSLAQNAEDSARFDREQYEAEAVEARIRSILAKPQHRLTDEEIAIRHLAGEVSFQRQLAEDSASLSRLAQARGKALASGALNSSAPPANDAVSFALSNATTLDEVVERWATERKVSAKGVDDHQAVVRWFVQRTGKSAVEAITKRDVISFKDKLVGEGASLANVKVKLSRLRTLLNWAAANDIIDANPAKDVQVVVTDADRNKRKPFDLASLRAIFSSPIYSQDERPTEGRGEAAYWLPLLALFTGARLEELGQLRPTDVRQEVFAAEHDGEDAAWFIHVVEDKAGDLKLKNAGSERAIPVHPLLHGQGFVRFVQDAQAAGHARLFPELRPNKYGRLTAKWGEWFGDYKREVVGVTDRRQVFHSFRHTFKDHGRGRMAEGVQRQIMGHSSGDVADAYGSGFPTWQLVDAMRQYKVPGFLPPPPPPAYR